MNLLQHMDIYSMWINKLVNYFRHSNFVVAVYLNPFGWNFFPYLHTGSDPYCPDNSTNIIYSWLFLKIVLKVDDGSY